MNYVNYSREITKRGELMENQRPLIDYVNPKQYKEAQRAWRFYQAAKVGVFIVANIAFWAVIVIMATEVFVL